MRPTIRTQAAIIAATALVTASRAWPQTVTPKPSEQTSTVQTAPMEPRALKNVQQAVDEVVNRQQAVLDQLSREINDWTGTMDDLGNEVADQADAFLRDPSDEQEAELSRVICEGSAKGAEAARRVAELKSTVWKQTALIREGLEKDIAEGRTFLRECQTSAVASAEQLEKARKAGRRLKRALEERGCYDGKPIPPELEIEAYKLTIDIQELDLTAQIDKDTAMTVGEYLEVMQDAEKNLGQVDVLVEKLAYGAAAAGRMFQRIGAAETYRIEIHLLAEGYSSLYDMRDNLVRAKRKLDEMSVLPDLVKMRRHVPSPRRRRRAEDEPQMQAAATLRFLASLDEKPKATSRPVAVAEAQNGG